MMLVAVRFVIGEFGSLIQRSGRVVVQHRLGEPGGQRECSAHVMSLGWRAVQRAVGEPLGAAVRAKPG